MKPKPKQILYLRVEVELYEKIELAAQSRNLSKTEICIQLLTASLKILKPNKSSFHKI